MLYGSGNTNEATAERTGASQPQPMPSPLSMMNDILMAPFTILSTIFPKQEEKKVQTRYTRAFLPQGGVKPTMTSQEMNKKNIFGEGGGY
jgi:hypothetical protein